MEKNTITTKYQQNSHTGTPTSTYIYILILRGFFLIAHICYYVQVISIWGGGGGFAPIKLV